MGAKRKPARNSTSVASSSTSLSPKKEPPAESQFVPQDDDEDNLWSAIEILDEKGVQGKGQYLVKWAGVDRSTGKPWAPTWEPKHNCTQDLIDDWHERKEKNPTIVGREGRKLVEEEKKAKSANKRKRGDRSRSGSKKLKMSVEVASSARGRKSRGRDSSMSESDSPDFPEPVEIDRTEPNTRTRTRAGSVKEEAVTSSPATRLGLRDRKNKRSTYQEPSSESDHGSPDESSFEPSSASDPTNRATKAVMKSSPAKAKVPPRAKGGPGPSTAAHRSKEASPTRLEGSIPESQADPIYQFSSRPSPQGNAAGANENTNTRNDPAPANGESRDDVEGPIQGTTGVTAEAIQDGGSETESPPKSGKANPAAHPEPQEEQHCSTTDALEEEIDDADLDDLRSEGEEDIPDEGENTTIPNGQDDHTMDNNDHEHPVHNDNNITADSQPNSSANTFPKTQDIPTAAVPPEPHPDTIALAEARQRIAALASQLYELNRRWMLYSQSPHPPPAPAITVDEAPNAERSAPADASMVDISTASQSQPGFESHPAAPIATSDIAPPAQQPPPSQSSPLNDLSHELLQASSTIRELAAETEGLKAKLSRAESEIQVLEQRIQSQSLPSNDEPHEPSQADIVIKEQAAEIKRLVAKLTEAKSENQALERRNASLVNDNNFLRGQYKQASDRAVEEVRAAKDLRAQLTTLKSQLTLGLKQRDIHKEKIAKDKENAIRKLQAQVHILLQQSRLTDDKIRMKATFYDKYKKERDGMQTSIEDLTIQVHNLKERKEALINLIETIRAQKMGIIPSEEGGAENEDSDYESSAISSSSDISRPPSPSDRRQRAGGYAQPRSDFSARSTPVHGNRVPLPQPGTIDILASSQKEGYVCAWRDGDQVCRVVCDTVEELHDHGIAHQHAALANRR
ncbi:hypothetical protein IAT40_006451 [Kwoniella sp. CBS 6097]